MHTLSQFNCSYNLVDTAERFSSCLARLQRAEPIMFLDLEFARSRTYVPKLCLIQIATSEQEVFLIDPCVETFDLEPLYTLLCNPAVKKVFYAAKQDLELLSDRIVQLDTNIFDLQLAAMLDGAFDAVSYEYAVKSVLNQSLDKSLQHSDWSKRPLLKAQLDYAALDVFFLPPLYTHLHKQLERTQRLQWMDVLIKEMLAEIRHAKATRFSNPKALMPPQSVKQKPRYLRLALWRERVAANCNVTRKRVVSNEDLARIADSREPIAAQLKWLKDHTLIVLDAHWYDALETLLTQSSPPEELTPLLDALCTRHRPPTQKEYILRQSAKLMLHVASLNHRVAPQLLGNSADIERFVTEPSKPSRLREGWRKPLIGDPLEAFLTGNTCLIYENQRLVHKKWTN